MSPVRGGEPDHLHVGRQGDARLLAGDDHAAGAIRRQDAGALRQTPARIDDNACRIGAGNASDGQLRIVGQRGPDPDHHRIDQGAQTMQMSKAVGTIDVFGISAVGGDTSIDRLAKLADDHKIVHHTVP